MLGRSSIVQCDPPVVLLDIAEQLLLLSVLADTSGERTTISVEVAA